jgi:hypothetical protein
MNRLRKKRDFTIYVKRRLEHWATWFMEGNNCDLGYHPQSIIHVLMTVGILVKSSGPAQLPCDEDAEEIEALVYEMWKQNRNLANALRHYYLSKGSLREKSNFLNVSHVHFKYTVDMARQWLAGRLSAANH